ncbi:hypothetical protein [Vibrio phage vB_VhaS-a]|nr:hypothetical protein [Vibrio phage vB_VhaS-a]
MKNITIADLLKKTTNVPVALDENGLESINVRGISIRDIGSLYREHKDIMIKLVGKEDDVKDDNGGIDWGKVIDVSPEFIAQVIARGVQCTADEAASLPVGIQARLVVGIWNASQIDQTMIEEVVKKILAALTNVNAAIGSKI